MFKRKRTYSPTDEVLVGNLVIKSSRNSPALPPPPPYVRIDYSSFPHIIHQIVAIADYEALVPLRRTCRAISRRADNLLAHHIEIRYVQPGLINVTRPGGLPLPGYRARHYSHPLLLRHSVNQEDLDVDPGGPSLLRIVENCRIVDLMHDITVDDALWLYTAIAGDTRVVRNRYYGSEEAFYARIECDKWIGYIEWDDHDGTCLTENAHRAMPARACVVHFLIKDAFTLNDDDVIVSVEDNVEEFVLYFMAIDSDPMWEIEYGGDDGIGALGGFIEFMTKNDKRTLTLVGADELPQDLFGLADEDYDQKRLKQHVVDAMEAAGVSPAAERVIVESKSERAQRIGAEEYALEDR